MRARSPTDEPLLLLVNVGNTHTILARYRAGRIGRRIRLRTDASSAARAEALRSLAGRAGAAGAALCSVVPAQDADWMRRLTAAAQARPLRIGPDAPLGVRLDVPFPRQVGADRLADAAAAFARYRAPAIVVDAGTATAISAIVKGRGFIGGAIAPGPALFHEYLAERTARLPRMGRVGRVPPFGRTTAAAMRLGAAVGYAGMVRALIEHLRRVPELRSAAIVITGGGGRALARAFGGEAIYDRDLTLFGIGLVAARVILR